MRISLSSKATMAVDDIPLNHVFSLLGCTYLKVADSPQDGKKRAVVLDDGNPFLKRGQVAGMCGHADVMVVDEGLLEVVTE